MSKTKIDKSLKKTSFFFKSEKNLLNSSFSYKIHLSYIVTKKVIDFIIKNKIKSVCLYLNELDQINTLGLIKWCLMNDKDVYIYNFEQQSNDFLIYPLKSLNYDIDNVQSFKNIVLNNVSPVDDVKFDLLILPVYFINQKKAYYYKLKNYKSVLQYNHQYLIGIGYENILINHHFWNRILFNKKQYFIEFDYIFLAKELISKNKK